MKCLNCSITIPDLPDCGEETHLGEFGHTDDDLYFYDGIEVQEN